MRSTPPPENIDCASLLACLASSPVGRPPDSADSHVGCRITMSVTQRRYSAATGALQIRRQKVGRRHARWGSRREVSAGVIGWGSVNAHNKFIHAAGEPGS